MTTYPTNYLADNSFLSAPILALETLNHLNPLTPSQKEY